MRKCLLCESEAVKYVIEINGSELTYCEPCIEIVLRGWEVVKAIAD